MPEPRTRVIKIGGSLLDLPDLGDRLQQFFVQWPASFDVLIIGGGNVVDAIRTLDETHGLGEQTAHWLSIDALSLTARVLGAVLPDCKIERRFDHVVQRCRERETAATSSRVIFDPASFLRHDEPRRPGISLPHGWHVTSDSIAARVAELLKADELVLFKSVSTLPAADWNELAVRRVVDGYFPQIAKRLRSVKIQSLR